MPRLRLLPKTDEWPGWRIDAIALLTLAAGFGVRYRTAVASFVNPGEACQALLARPETLRGLWSSALQWAEPPLFVILLHYVRALAPADLGTRLLPLIAGTLLPWAVYLWIGRVWNRLAGLAALATLSLAPQLIRLGAEARAGVLALLFIAGALYWLDRAIERNSAWPMAAFGVCLWGATLSDHSAALFILAAAVYFLLRSRGERVSAGVWIVWGLSQAGAVALYGLLWTAQLRALRTMAAGLPGEGWLWHSCLSPGLDVGLCGFLRGGQSWRSLLPAAVPETAAVLLFMAGLYFIWRRPPGGAVWHGRAMAALLVIPFLGACGASAAGLLPWGRTGGEALPALFAIAGAAVAVDRIARRSIVPLTLIAAVAVPGWYGVEARRESRDAPKELMEQALDFLKRSAPPGTVMLTEGEFAVVLAYYLEPDAGLPETHGRPSEEDIAGWRLFANRWAFASVEDLRTDLRLVRERYGFRPDVRIWVLDGGCSPRLEPYFEELNRRGKLPHLYQFGRAMVAALTPPGFMWADPGAEDAQARGAGDPPPPAIPESE